MVSPAHPLSAIPIPSLFRLDVLSRVLRVVLAVVIGALCYQLGPADFDRITRLMMGWDGFLVSILQLTWLTIFRAQLEDIEQISRKMHPDRTWLILLIVTFVGICVCLLAVVLLLQGIHEMAVDERFEHVLVSLVAVAGTWLLLHTLFALHYAHTYFSLDAEAETETGRQLQRHGMLFNGAQPVSYWDFAYFSFIVGMTAQTADVALTSLRMRRLVLFHGMLAFAFNTAIVALSINILSGLL